MVENPVLALYERFVKPENKNVKLVLADDTDPGSETTDHLDSPWVCAAMGQIYLSQHITPGTPVTVPFSKNGPSLVLYWQCKEISVVILSDVYKVTMPNGRMAVLYYDGESNLIMKAYYAW